MISILNDVQGIQMCYCHCCRSDPCIPVPVGSFFVGGLCNSTTCNQNICFAFNTTLCPAIGSSGNVYPICASAYPTFKRLNFVPIIITFTFFVKFYQY